MNCLPALAPNVNWSSIWREPYPTLAVEGADLVEFEGLRATFQFDRGVVSASASDRAYF